MCGCSSPWVNRCGIHMAFPIPIKAPMRPKRRFLSGVWKVGGAGRKDRPLDLGADYLAEFRQALSMGSEEAASRVLDRLAASLREGEAVASALYRGFISVWSGNWRRNPSVCFLTTGPTWQKAGNRCAAFGGTGYD